MLRIVIWYVLNWIVFKHHFSTAVSAKYPNTIWALLLNKWTVFWWSIQSYWNNFGPIGKRWWGEFETRQDIIICHSSTSIRVTKMLFCQNGVLLGRSFWPKDSLVTLLLFELWLLWVSDSSHLYFNKIWKSSSWMSQWLNDLMEIELYSFMYLKIFSPYF